MAIAVLKADLVSIPGNKESARWKLNWQITQTHGGGNGFGSEIRENRYGRHYTAKGNR